MMNQEQIKKLADTLAEALAHAFTQFSVSDHVENALANAEILFDEKLAKAIQDVKERCESHIDDEITTLEAKIIELPDFDDLKDKIESLEAKFDDLPEFSELEDKIDNLENDLSDLRDTIDEQVEMRENKLRQLVSQEFETHSETLYKELFEELKVSLKEMLSRVQLVIK